MVRVLLILSFVLVHMHDDSGLTEATVGYPRWSTILKLWAAMALLWFCAHAVVRFAAARMDAGNLAWAFRARLVVACSRVAGLVVLALGIYEFELMDTVRALIGEGLVITQLVVLLPFWLLVTGGYVSEYQLERRMREALFYRAIQAGSPVEPIDGLGMYLWLEVRHEILWWLVPLWCMSAAVGWSESLLGAYPNVGAALGETGGALVKLVVAFAVYCVMPVVIRRVWRTSELSGGELRERILAICREHGVRVRGPIVWRTGTGLLNAAMLGVLYPMRYIVFTDRLLETLTPSQLDAVTAHEVAHLRRKHAVWLILLALAGLQVVGLLLSVVEWAAASAGVRWLVGDSQSLSYATVMTFVSLGATAAVVCLGCRRFEWQADAFAARHLSKDAGGPSATITAAGAGAMADALIAVAYHNGVHENRTDLLHGSILLRRKKLLALVGLPSDRLPIDRASRLIRWGALAALVGGAALNLYFGGVI